MPPPKELLDLIERFDRNAAAYRAGEMNETQVRREFIDPLFEILGWDVGNRQGHAPAYREVVHEDTVKIGGLTKAPDYSFRVGGVRKFFLEAKKPSVSLADDPGPAYQLRRYAWSAGLPLSVLTDFEEFVVYDCRVRPKKTDKPSTARTLYLTYKEYAERWDEIASIFARKAILQGSFDKFAAAGKKKGTEEVDDAFLEEIEKWREALAKEIATRNRRLTQRELNFAVQRTIDRIVFLRICEDRGAEEYGRLLALTNGPHVYERLIERFERADERYNSGLFHFRAEKDRAEAPDELTLRLKIDDDVLAKILKGLYYPDCPYEFSVLPAEILGAVYERFLGKVIRLTEGHRAKVEEKPEVKKAGGVYYTPHYIVEYIVKETLGRLLEGKSPKQAAKIRVLDPACGSGSFLLGAYRHLLIWYRDRYVEDGTEKHPKELVEVRGAWHLTTAEKKRILLANIHGVDIDLQAVEVTKLSLLLKVLEGETETSLTQLSMFHQRALPDLGANIKCGNSLIGPDFFTGEQTELFDDETRLRVNAFDWQTEFPEIMKAGGFDAVIGNPPYYKVSGRTDPHLMTFFKDRYKTAGYKTEMYALFTEKSFLLLNRGGFQSFIIPNSFLAGVFLRPLRSCIAHEHVLLDLVLLKDVKVFENAKLDSVIYVAKNEMPRGATKMTLRLSDQTLNSRPEQVQSLIHSEWSKEVDLPLQVTQGAVPKAVWNRIVGASVALKEIGSVHLGLVLESNELLSDKPSSRKPDPILLGRDIGRFGPAKPRHWFSFKRDPIVGGTKNPSVYGAGPRILIQAIRNLRLPRRLVCTVVPAGTFTMGTLHNVLVKNADIGVHALLGILNSTLLNAYYAAHFPEHRIKGAYLDKLPIQLPDAAKRAEIERLVGEAIHLAGQAPAAKTDHERTAIDRQIAATDKEIDRIVYELYGLTDDEIRIVEGETR